MLLGKDGKSLVVNSIRLFYLNLNKIINHVPFTRISIKMDAALKIKV